MTENDSQYSMRLVTRLTGLSPDTVRAWERRYGAVVPRRTEGNTRKFSSEDVRRLSLLKEAIERGHRIGDIARMPEAALKALTEVESSMSPPTLVETTEGDIAKNAFEKLRRDYLAAIRKFDVQPARDMIARASTVLNPRDFILEVILPIMRETGDLWERGELTIAQEHLISMQIRGLLESIMRLSSPHPGVPRIVVATPSGQIHEFGALAGSLWAGMRGFDVIYLGADVPTDDLIDAMDRSQSDVLLLSVVLEPPPEALEELISSMSRLTEKYETWVGIDPGHPIVGQLGKARSFHRFEDLDMALTELLR